MKKCIAALLFFSVGVLLFCAAGCRNHLSTVETDTIDYDRSTPDVTYIVENQTNLRDLSMMRLKLTKTESSALTTYTVHSVISRYTPYSFWRKFYEFPMGVCLVPVSLVSHLINVFTIGIFPYSWASAVTCTAAAGMNPFINVESDSRFVEVIDKRVKKVIDKKTEVTPTAPAAHIPVKVGNGNLTFDVTARENGIVELHLLDLKGNGPTMLGDREIQVFIAGKTVPSLRIPIERKRQNLLLKASQLLQDYHKQPSGKGLASVVLALENMSFVDFAYKLEKEELAKYRKPGSSFFAEFQKEIEKSKK
jgi:hypothetical protein